MLLLSETYSTESYFSDTYETARHRFLDATKRIGGRVESYALATSSKFSTDDPLSMDVGILGPETGPTIIISSGLHGVEGFAGSAVQLAWLERLSRNPSSAKPIRYVLIHAINPYGFAKRRRVNEENIDLNRNFLIPPEQYAGASDGYRRLNRFLNPASPPSKFELFKLKVIWNIVRYGLPKLKESVACGQYDFPSGLFFGGNGPAWSTQVLQQHCDQWLGSTKRIIHIDIHTGLGKFGSYKLLVTERQPNENLDWYQAAYGAEAVEMLAKPGGTAYQASGVFGTWMQNHFSDCEYRSVGAEFGTYDVVRILAALRAENRAHHYASPDSPMYRKAKEELIECFCPASKQWRDALIESGLKIVEQSAQALDRHA